MLIMIKKRKKPVFIETKHQIEIVKYAGYKKLSNGYMLSDFLIKIHNEGRKNKIAAYIDKKSGLKSGVSDLFLALPNERYHGMWIEVKKKGGKLTKNQQEWFNKMYKIDYYTCICYDVDDFIRETDEYLKEGYSR